MSAHIQMVWPLPFRSTSDPDSQQRDYDMTSPLSMDGSNFPCKGYHEDDSRRSTATYEAGDEYNVTFSGSATHAGGSCQLSLSYDEGATFKVIKSMVGGCPLESSYQFRIPDFAPSGSALFAWTWMNHDGNREYYMNCAQVEIENPSSGDASSLDMLPNIWVGNLGSVNDCQVPEGTNVVFPNPGRDVEYGDGESSSSRAFEGECEYPETSSVDSSTDSSGNVSDDSYAESEASPVNEEDGDDITDDGSQGSREDLPENDSGEGSTEHSHDHKAEHSHHHGSEHRVVDTHDDNSDATEVGPDEVQHKNYEVQYKNSNENPYHASDSDTDDRKPTSDGGQSDKLRDKSMAMFFEVAEDDEPAAAAREGASDEAGEERSSSQTYTTLVTSTVAGQAIRPTASYASDGTDAYLPCTPGKFLCIDENTFVTCMSSDDGSDYSSTYYSSARTVAPGMFCRPYWAPPASEGNSREFYRDDRYVRARPEGDCEYIGALQCTDAGRGMGSGFWICDHGGWIDMGYVSAGTVCVDGEIRDA